MSGDPVIPNRSSPWPDAPSYFEGNVEGFDVYEWSPAPPGTENAPVTQVHLHGIASFGRVAWRFKSNRTLDRLIAALLKHRWGVFKVSYEEELEAELRVIRDQALEDAASLFESVNPASDEERAGKVPGAGAMGAVLEFRDLIRSRKGKR